MFKLAFLPLAGALAFTTAAQVHQPVRHSARPVSVHMHARVADAGTRQTETLSVYYSPLESTRVTARLGFGVAYHMALVYTDRAGNSYGASSGPSIASSAQTPEAAISAVFYMADDQPSTFGTLESDPKNDTPFIKGSAADYYTKDGSGHAYPHAVVAKGKDLSAQWASILQTYATIGNMQLTYSPMSQNSNSLAATALKRAGVPIAFSSETRFAPGIFTQLPMD